MLQTLRLPASNATTVEDLRCEYLVDPLGIDVVRPRLGWILQSALREQKQTAYQVLVASSPAKLVNDQGDLWDSGKVPSDQSIQVEYAGKALASRQTCWWKVRVWNRHGISSAWSAAAHWTTGLSDPRDWQASWIGVKETPPAGATAVGPLRIISASYQALGGTPARDVTELVSRKVSGNSLSLAVDNDTLGGDFACGTKKQLVVEYELAGGASSNKSWRTAG